MFPPIILRGGGEFRAQKMKQNSLFTDLLQINKHLFFVGNMPAALFIKLKYLFLSVKTRLFSPACHMNSHHLAFRFCDFPSKVLRAALNPIMFQVLLFCMFVFVQSLKFRSCAK